MAEYIDLYDLHDYAPLINRVSVACVVAAEVVHSEAPETDNHANRLIWAAAALASPRAEATRMYWSLLGTYKDLTIAAIQEASDAQIQGAVEAHIDLFATEV